jgi:HAD superfamily hydrolase (TIGR01549 family)
VRGPKAGVARALRAVVFDFDGVILESIDVKTRAFVALFNRWPQHAEEIRRLHLENAGVSRYEKFVRIHRDIIGVPLDDAELARLGDEFSQLIRDEMLNCEFVVGARELLERLSDSHLLFVASGTPEAEMREIVQARGLDRVFAGVYGSPASKAEILRRILDEHDFAADEVIFVGDALSDYEGARAVGVSFVARVPAGGPAIFPVDGVLRTVSDLRELDRRWDALEPGVEEWSV